MGWRPATAPGERGSGDTRWFPHVWIQIHAPQGVGKPGSPDQTAVYAILEMARNRLLLAIFPGILTISFVPGVQAAPLCDEAGLGGSGS